MRTNTFSKLHRNGGALLMLFFLMGMFIFDSCTAEDTLIEDTQIISSSKEKNVTLSLDFTISGGMQTRAGRELWSRQPLQQVNNLKLWVFRGTGSSAEFVKTIAVPQFSNTTPVDTEKRTLRMQSALPGGTYTILAIGFESDSEDYDTYSLPSAEGLTLGEMTLTLNGNKHADEMFAGVSDAPVEVSDETDLIRGDITLYRVTAGVVAYFTHIPYWFSSDKDSDAERLIRVTSVKVLASARGTECSLLPSEKFKYLASSEEETELLSFDLTPFEKDEENNWYRIDRNDWRGEKREEAPKGVAKLADSLLGGLFLLPFPKQERSTLRVALYDENGDELKSYKVVDTDNGVKTDLFPILANHYYGIGVKYTNSGIDPNDPENPDEPEVPFEEDKPVDLSKEQVLNITVMAGWDNRHDLMF